jgi:3-phenylpropionate/trans-cinnamate dioxygenase ferredoxin subunit
MNSEAIEERKEARWVEVARAEDIAPGSFVCVYVEGQPIDVFNVDGEYYAIGDVCTHAETSLADGEFYEDIRGWVIECPLHGSLFDVTTGEAISLPATGNAGKYEVKVEDGTVYLNPDAVVDFTQ